MPDSEKNRKELLDHIEQLIEAKDFEKLREVLSEARSSDVAEVVEVLDEIARQILFDLLDPRDAGEVLEKIDEATRSQVVEDLTSEELTKFVATLPPDEAADVVADLSEEQSEEILEKIPKAESDQIEKLLEYDEDSAGGIMNPELVTTPFDGTVRDAIHRFREADPEEDFWYIFVVDDGYRYKGVVGLDTLLRHPRNTPVGEVLEEEIPTVDIGADQEEIANIFRRNDLFVMPVVDKNGVLLGRITVDDVVDVMEEEAEEDALVMAGTHPAELETPNIFRAAGVRLPWLMTCLIGSFMYTVIYLFYQTHFSAEVWTSILMFVPAIAAMGGNSGLQTSTIVVRGLATGDLAALKITQVLLREMRIALIIACVCGIAAGALSSVVLHIRSEGGTQALEAGTAAALSSREASLLGLAVGLAMFCGIMVATSVGLLLPFAFRRLGIDPAISSGPFVTTANDSLGCLAYFSIALGLIHSLG